MVREIDYLILLCKAYLNGQSITLDENIDYEKLYVISNRHNLSAIAFAVINTSKNRSVVGEKAFALFQEDFFEAVMRYSLQSEVKSELSSLLCENRIYHIFFKGADFRDLFPVPEARVMGDIDVLIKEADRLSVKELLNKNGFESESANGPVYNYVKDGALIEMHSKLINDKIGRGNCEEYFKSAFENAKFDGCSGRLEINYHFAYLIAHIAHHFRFYGAGIKLILDLAVLLKNAEVEPDKALSILKDAGLDDFARVILTVCKKWFGYGESYVENTDETEMFLMNFGAFGNINRNNAAVIERKELEEGKAVTPFKTRLRLLFPSYEKLKDIDYINFIEGRPYLTPAAWVYRAFYNFKNKKSFVVSSVKAIGSDETKSEAERELAYFKEIGLL